MSKLYILSVFMQVCCAYISPTQISCRYVMWVTSVVYFRTAQLRQRHSLGDGFAIRVPAAQYTKAPLVGAFVVFIGLVYVLRENKSGPMGVNVDGFC